MLLACFYLAKGENKGKKSHVTLANGRFVGYMTYCPRLRHEKSTLVQVYNHYMINDTNTVTELRYNFFLGNSYFHFLVFPFWGHCSILHHWVLSLVSGSSTRLLTFSPWWLCSYIAKDFECITLLIWLSFSWLEVFFGRLTTQISMVVHLFLVFSYSIR